MSIVFLLFCLTCIIVPLFDLFIQNHIISGTKYKHEIELEIRNREAQRKQKEQWDNER